MLKTRYVHAHRRAGEKCGRNVRESCVFSSAVDSFPSLRAQSGYRDDAQRDPARVTFIRSCQEIGSTLKELFDLQRVLA